MSQAGDSFRALSRPLRSDAPFVGDWTLAIDLRPANAISPPDAVLACLRDQLDDASTLGALVEFSWHDRDDRGARQQPPCSHVVAPGTYRAIASVADARLAIDGVAVRAFVNVDGCERCITRLSVAIPEDDVRAAWRALHGSVEGDDELRPWRYQELFEPRLRVIAQQLEFVESGWRGQLRWGDSRGTTWTWLDGAWSSAGP